ncbi:MAG TPA: NAD(P)H-dependent oxidoreductase [Nocardioidaceae bacterium]|nr:NAD(P)H-dependent oxidoreductase [Nocardioidaceae bacterium]
MDIISGTSKHVRIALIVASVRTPRLADVLLLWLREQLADIAWLELDVIDLADVDLDLRGTRAGGSDSPISKQLDLADGYLVLTPEYNHSFPAALKNAIDWHFEEWQYKPVSFVGYGAGSGGLRAIEQLRLIFPELRATTTRNAVALTAPWERITADGTYDATEGSVAALHATLAELHWWALALRDGRRVHAVPA